MASGFWPRAGTFTFSYFIARNTRVTTMSMKHLWKYQMSNAIHLVSHERFYISEKWERFEDIGSDGATGTGSVSSESSQGQDEDDPVMQDLIVKYERYRLWLAKIMGKDPENFTDKEIKETIEYLMPSGLYAKDARPLFEDPKRLYKKQAELVDKNSRPLHAAFFTGQIGFHDLLFQIYEQNAILDTDENPGTSKESEARKYGGYTPDGSQGSNLVSSKQLLIGTEHDVYASSKSESSSDANSSSDSDPESTNDSMPDLRWDENSGKIPANDRLVTQDTKETESGKSATQPKMRWIGKLEMEKKIGERLTDKEYDVITHRLKKLASRPNASRVTPFLLQFIHVISIQGMRAVERKLNDKGEAVAVGHRKRAIAEVVIKKGSGSVAVNNTPMAKYFGRVEDRKQIMYPFLTVGAVGEYDVDCGVIGGGTSGQAGAIRLALSRALLNFEDSYLEPLQEAGLLIRDPRIKERKKPGQKRARKKFAWVRR